MYKPRREFLSLTKHSHGQSNNILNRSYCINMTLFFPNDEASSPTYHKTLKISFYKIIWLFRLTPGSHDNPMKAFYTFAGQCLAKRKEKTNSRRKLHSIGTRPKIQENIGRLSNERIHTNQVNRILRSPIINLTLTLKEWWF
jgi:hypothetical protein